MAQSSRPGSRSPNQSSGGGRRPRVAGLRKRAQAGASEEQNHGEVTADSGVEPSGVESSGPEPSGSEGSASEPSATSSESGTAKDAEHAAASDSASTPEKSSASGTTDDESGSGSGTADPQEPTASTGGPDSTGGASSKGDESSKGEADSKDEVGAGAATSSATTPGAIKPQGKTGSSGTARPTGRGKRTGTRLGAARSGQPQSGQPQSGQSQSGRSGDESSSELPRAKPVQDTPTAVADREETAEEQAQSSGRASDKPAWMSDRRVWFLGSLGLSVVFGLIAVLFGAMSLGYLGGSQSNEALVDKAATSEVNGQVTDAVNKVFSYDFNNTEKTEDAAHQFLTGNAIKQYNDLFATVKQQAPQQKLVVTTSVKSSGVTRLQGDHAQVLLFVDQNATRTTTGENNVGPAQISVGAVKDGDQWKIDSIIQR